LPKSDDYDKTRRLGPNQGPGTATAAAVDADALKPGTLCGAYVLKKELASGGGGTVYEAQHRILLRRAAVKVLRRQLASSPQMVARFLQEARAVNMIKHPNIVDIFEFDDLPDGRPFYVMELLDGIDLRSILNERGRFPPGEVLEILEPVCSALQAAHDLGIVHRDLKPDNIMVMTARGRDIVKVVDFGIAKATDAKSSGQKVTKTGLVVGTPEYMSPEQLSGDPCDGRSDLYSLALVFYRMITGKLPFEADTAQETMIKRLTDEPLPLALARPDLRFPVLLQTVLNRSLTRSPADRYATAVEFGRDLATATAAMTGVDLEAGTQVVKPEEMDRLLATVPPTRVDPDIQRISQGLKTVVAKPDRAGKKIPVAPIAAIALIAVAGGAYAMRGTLFGGTPIQKVDSLPAQSRPETTTVLVAGRVDTTNSLGAASQTTTKLTGASGLGTQSPPDSVRTVSNPSIATSNPPVDLSKMASQVHEFADDLEFADNDARRSQGKQLGQKAYATEGLPDKSRAEAAFVVSQALIKEEDRDGARLWLQRAYDLDARPVWKDILERY